MFIVEAKVFDRIHRRSAASAMSHRVKSNSCAVYFKVTNDDDDDDDDDDDLGCDAESNCG
jgi:hypothetical protein